MLSYHNDPAIKAAHVAQAQAHYDADMLVTGTYGKATEGGFKGCSVGCFAYEIAPERLDRHAVVAEAAGWPLWLVYLSDQLFEGLPAGEREKFHVDLRKAVPVGVDLDPVQYHIAIARHERSIARLAGNNEPYARQCIDALKGAIEWCRAEIAGTSSKELRSAAESAAESAVSAAKSAALTELAELAGLAARSAESAAWSAVSAADSTWLAAESAAWSALSTTWSAAWAAAESARCAEYQAERDALFSVLRSMQRTAAQEGSKQ